MLDFRKNIVITGHYGCGKTNLAIGLALALAKKGPVTVVDLDIVNPYFRTAERRELLEAHGVRLLAPNFAGTNLDVPSLPGSILGELRAGSGTMVFDVGGDDAGAVALGQYAALLEERGYEMLYVVNPYRLLTSRPEDAAESLRQIEAASRLRATALVNNANLGPLTTPAVTERGIAFGKRLSGLTGLPVRFTVCTPGSEPEENDSELFPMKLYIKPVD